MQSVIAKCGMFGLMLRSSSQFIVFNFDVDLLTSVRSFIHMRILCGLDFVTALACAPDLALHMLYLAAGILANVAGAWELGMRPCLVNMFMHLVFDCHRNDACSRGWSQF